MSYSYKVSVDRSELLNYLRSQDGFIKEKNNTNGVMIRDDLFPYLIYVAFYHDTTIYL